MGQTANGLEPDAAEPGTGNRVTSHDDKSSSSTDQSYVLVARDYADIAHLENPNVIERILSGSRGEKVAYVSALITSGLSRLVVAGPKVAFTAMAAEVLTDFGREVSEWIQCGRIPEDFSGRPLGYQTWVELLQEIDSNPIDADRIKALKAMFLEANRIAATDGQQILAYQLFQIAKKLTSGDLLVLKAAYDNQGTGQESVYKWLGRIANFQGHGATALVEQHERVLMDYGLLNRRISPDQFGNGMRVMLENGRLTDLGLAFCRNLQNYQVNDSAPTGSGS